MTSLPPLPPSQSNAPWADPFAQHGLDMDSSDLSLLTLWRVLVRRRRLVLLVLMLALLAGVWLATRPRTYVATGTLQVRSGTSNQFRFDAAVSSLAGNDLDDRIESEVSVLESKSLYYKVAEQLHLASNPAIVGKRANPNATMADPVLRARVLSAMSKMIKVERLPKTENINISCTTISPLLSTQIVSTLMDQYVERIFNTQFSSTQRVAKFLTSQLGDLKNQVLEDQQKLVDLQGKLGVVGFDDSHNLVTAQLEDLARANEQADIARITAEARYRILQDESPELMEGGLPLLGGNTQQNSQGSLLQTLRSTEAQLRSHYASVSEQFGPNYPETRRLKAELAEASAAVVKEQNRVMEQAKIAYNAAASNQRMTQSALSSAEGNAFGRRNDMVQYEILLHDYQSSRTLYEGLMSRLREAGVISGLQSSEIELIDLPMLPVAPSGYGPLVLIAISLALGLVVAFLLAMLVESLDTSLHSVDDVERAVNLPAFAVLPSYNPRDGMGPRRWFAKANRDADSASGKVPGTTVPEVIRAPLSPFTEGVRLLRSSLLLSQPGRPPRTLMLTSAMPREGKSTVCSNLACVLAQNGAKVLLMDADLRRPLQHRYFGLPNKTGLSSVLTGAATLAESAQPVKDVPSLHVLTSGPVAPSPGQLLASEAMRSLIAEGLETYDFVMLDSPPGLAIADASTLASMVDTVLLVVREGVANRKMVRRTAAILHRVGANLQGFVFNGVRRGSVEYYEYKGRNGYYGQGDYATRAAADGV